MHSYWLSWHFANFLPGLTWNFHPPNLHLLSRWDYRPEPLCPALCSPFIEINNRQVASAVHWNSPFFSKWDHFLFRSKPSRAKETTGRLLFFPLKCPREGKWECPWLLGGLGPYPSPLSPSTTSSACFISPRCSWGHGCAVASECLASIDKEYNLLIY
jgi:hypothetical protein